MHEKMEKKRKGIFVAVCIMNRGVIRQFFPETLCVSGKKCIS